MHSRMVVQKIEEKRGSKILNMFCVDLGFAKDWFIASSARFLLVGLLKLLFAC